MNARPILLLLAASSGCLSDADPEDLTSTEQPITFSGFRWGNNTEDLDLGSASDKTCFLSGVKGSLKAFPDGNGSPYTEARASVRIRADNHWWVETRRGNGPGVEASGNCVPLVGNRVFIATQGLYSGGSYSPSVPALRQRQCYLTSVEAHGQGWSGNLTLGGPPGVEIRKEGSNWVFRAYLVQNSNGENSGTAIAVCFDAWTTGDFGAEAGSGVLTLPLFSNGGDKACGLSSLFGVFDQSWNHPGANVFPDDSGGWSVELAPHMRITTSCVK